jgi:hypothetical protein
LVSLLGCLDHFGDQQDAIAKLEIFGSHARGTAGRRPGGLRSCLQDCSLRRTSSTTSLTTWSAAAARIMALIPRARVIVLTG